MPATPTPPHVYLRLNSDSKEALAETMEAITKRMGDSIRWNPEVREGGKHGDFLAYGEFLPHRERRRRESEETSGAE